MKLTACAVALGVILTAGAITASSQLGDGDLIVLSAGYGSSDQALFAYDSGRGTWSTVSLIPGKPSPAISDSLWGVRMGIDNRSLVYAGNERNMKPGRIYKFDPAARATTVIATIQEFVISYELDHDGWVVSGAEPKYNGLNLLWLLRHTKTPGRFVLSTLAKPFPQVGANVQLALDMTIARDFTHGGAGPYIMALQDNRLNVLVPRLMVAGRSGKVSTLLATTASSTSTPFRILSTVEVDPVTGNLLTGDRSGFLCQMETTGSMRTVARAIPALYPRLADEIRFGQDGTCWVALTGNPSLLCTVDQRCNFTKTVKVPLLSSRTIRGLEIYGSRRLVCKGSGMPGTSYTIDLHSLRVGDRGKPYALACSFLRRPHGTTPCLDFGGAYLFLDHLDPLFWATAGCYWPKIFDQFRGALDKNGRATAYVHVPSNLPKLNGLTIFVAGVIYDGSGVRTVTNTHWFVLP